MLHNIHSLTFLLAFLHILSLTAAWPWPPSLENLGGLVYRRAESDSASESAKPTATAKESKTAKASATDNGSTITSAPASSTGAAESKGSKETKAKSGASKTDDSASKTTKKAAKTSAVDDRLPAGNVVMLTPAVTAATTYYKVGDMVTFGWNYTLLSIPPHHIDVYVTCTANSATYTISNNATYKPTGKAVWNTSEDATGVHPLLTEQYTLVIEDSDADPTANVDAGYLAKFNELHFGMYTPQPYVSRKDGWKCAVCSDALSNMERQTLKFMFGMCIITVLSFTWFVGGIGLV